MYTYLIIYLFNYLNNNIISHTSFYLLNRCHFSWTLLILFVTVLLPMLFAIQNSSNKTPYLVCNSFLTYNLPYIINLFLPSEYFAINIVFNISFSNTSSKLFLYDVYVYKNIIIINYFPFYILNSFSSTVATFITYILRIFFTMKIIPYSYNYSFNCCSNLIITWL